VPTPPDRCTPVRALYINICICHVYICICHVYIYVYMYVYMYVYTYMHVSYTYMYVHIWPVGDGGAGRCLAGTCGGYPGVCLPRIKAPAPVGGYPPTAGGYPPTGTSAHPYS
jgi:hypothetical protein